MKKLLASFLLFAGLSGCAMIPSFWDDNENNVIVSIVDDIDKIDCTKKDYVGAFRAKSRTEWLITYASLKGSKDVGRMATPLDATIGGFVEKVRKETEVSVAYCTLKKSVMQNDSRRIAKAMLGRF